MMTTYNVDAFPEIKDVQRVELEILMKVARLCEERGFTYFIESGSALGAVRHDLSRGMTILTSVCHAKIMRSSWKLHKKN